MLVHKETMGILDTVWLGEFDSEHLPICRAVSLSDYPELDANDWWEISNNTKLAKKIRRFYPNIEPIVSAEGTLIDINILDAPQDELFELEKAELKKKQESEAISRGYTKRRKIRPKNLMTFLKRRVKL